MIKNNCKSENKKVGLTYNRNQTHLYMTFRLKYSLKSIRGMLTDIKRTTDIIDDHRLCHMPLQPSRLTTGLHRPTYLDLY